MQNMWYYIPVIITDEIKRKVSEVARRHDLSCVALFGSRATGKTHAGSDTDIAFMADREIDYSLQAQIRSDLSSALDIDDIELVNMSLVSPLLMRQISEKGKLLYERHAGTFIRFKVLSFKLYVETAPLRRLRERYLANFIKAHAY